MVVTPLELVERICDARVADIKPGSQAEALVLRSRNSLFTGRCQQSTVISLYYALRAKADL